jgi:hypothetical protein
MGLYLVKHFVIKSHFTYTDEETSMNVVGTAHFPVTCVICHSVGGIFSRYMNANIQCMQQTGFYTFTGDGNKRQLMKCCFKQNRRKGNVQKFVSVKQNIFVA